MPRFLISYDLIKRKDYPELINELTRLGAAKSLFSQWFLEINSTTFALRDHLKTYIDNDDKLMVLEFSKRPSWTFLLTAGAQWVDARKWPA